MKWAPKMLTTSLNMCVLGLGGQLSTPYIKYVLNLNNLKWINLLEWCVHKFN